jgi:hypothetical protein
MQQGESFNPQGGFRVFGSNRCFRECLPHRNAFEPIENPQNDLHLWVCAIFALTDAQRLAEIAPSCISAIFTAADGSCRKIPRSC